MKTLPEIELLPELENKQNIAIEKEEHRLLVCPPNKQEKPRSFPPKIVPKNQRRAARRIHEKKHQ
ncbi:MAG TPA: hypothetical protein QGF02_03185 [Candidatus Babeliales bacterium]|nr:hypothetical protein [Candidatus Babeliales bacterium]